MSDRVALAVQRNAFRFALTGLLGIWLSGCADATRFGESGSPFSNPFASASNVGAPTPSVSAAPLAQTNAPRPAYAVAARPSPVAVASAPTSMPDSTGAVRAQPVGGSANGWTATGGSPVIVGTSDDAAMISQRYGVPEAALLSANGLHSRSDIHSGMRIIIPVYNAHAQTRVAKAEDDRDAEEKHSKIAKRDRDDADSDKDSRKADRSDSDHKKHKSAKKSDDDDKDADADDKTEKKREKTAKLDKSEKSDKVAKREDSAKSEKSQKLADAGKSHTKDQGKSEKAPEVATTELPKAAHKKPETDMTPTGDVAAAAPSGEGKASENGQFRWPARGRIIQGFKSGGNDGINIALPEGTSVRAAEDGKVAYAGSALKGYGNLVLIRHANGFVTAYANNGELNVKSGDAVKRGQVIAKSGQTGDVASPQLHFELRKGQTPVDPTNYLAGL
jgi:murein DD-endopeptidase MepM/ murein hydrolase activator NlpD